MFAGAKGHHTLHGGNGVGVELASLGEGEERGGGGVEEEVERLADGAEGLEVVDVGLG